MINLSYAALPLAPPSASKPPVAQRDFLVRQTGRTGQNDPRTQRQSLRRFPPSNPPFQLLGFIRCQLQQAFGRPVIPKFYPMTTKLRRRTLARLLTLRLNGQLASYALCLESAGTMLVYSNRMSPDWARYSAGAIANAEVVRTAHSDGGMRCLDWGTGLQRYKLSGDATLHPHQNIHAWSSEMARGAWVWTQRARRRRLPQP
jgi:hypothetical protein